MKKKKKPSAARQANEVPEIDEAQYSAPQRPQTSPYTDHPVKICIGSEGTAYYVPKGLLQVPQWIESTSWMDSIALPDVHKDIGHILVHYLYTGLYQSLKINVDTPTTQASFEFRRAFLTCSTADTYNLPKLKQLAKHEMECHGTKLSIVEIVEAIKGDLVDFDRNNWFFEYLHEKTRAAFREDYTVFATDTFLNNLDSTALNKLMMKFVLELYNEKISSILNAEVGVEQTSRRCDGVVEDLPADEVADQFEAPSDEVVEQVSYEHDDVADHLPADGVADRFTGQLGEDVGTQDACFEQHMDSKQVEELPSVKDDVPWRSSSIWGNWEKKDKKSWKSITIPSVDCEIEPTQELERAPAEPEPEQPVDVYPSSPQPEPSYDEPLSIQESEALESFESADKDESLCNPAANSDAPCPTPSDDGGGLCLLRAKHLLEGDMWKSCQSCRAVVRQVAIQLSHIGAGEKESYKNVDEILIVR
jgi:hypothetical protein